MCAASGGKNYLLTEINKDAVSYYEEPRHPQQAYYSFIDASSQEALETYLKTFWEEMGTPEFASGANAISNLAFELKAGAETQADDLSPFVYAMY